MSEVKIKCSNCGHSFVTENDKDIAICPLCGQKVNVFESSMSNIDKIFQKASLINLDSESVKILEYIHKGDDCIKKNDFDALSLLANEMEALWPDNFWTITFKAISELKLVFTEPLDVEKYILNEQEMQEDLKARIYHLARYKYAVCPQRVFDKLNKIFPDVPSKNGAKEEWSKAPTVFDMKMGNITKDLESIKRLKEEYLPRLEKSKTSNMDNEVYQNIFRFDNMLNSAHDEMKRYENEANDFVQKDYEKTKNPGNKPLFLAFLINFIMSIGLILLGITNITLGAFVGYDSWFAIITEIISLFCFSAMFGYLINAIKPFSKGHPIFAFVSITIAIIFVVFGIMVVVKLGPNNIYQIIIYWAIMIAISIGFIVYSYPKIVRYKPYDVRACKTYIGNYPALVKNDFYVLFQFQFVIRG